MKWETTGGGEFSLAALKGKVAVLYFYPRDNTPGCTQEGKDFAAAHKAFAKLGAAVFGVSPDSLAAHEKFKAKFGFPFELVSDPEKKLCEKFKVWKEKTLYGRNYMGVERSTFVLGRNGKVLREWRGVKVPGHVDEVLAFVEESQ